jgi:hypothetical protein
MSDVCSCLAGNLDVIVIRIMWIDQHGDRRSGVVLVAGGVCQVLAAECVRGAGLRIRPLGNHAPVIAIHRHVIDASARLAALMRDIGDGRADAAAALAQIGDPPRRRNVCTNATPMMIRTIMKKTGKSDCILDSIGQQSLAHDA